MPYITEYVFTHPLPSRRHRALTWLLLLTIVGAIALTIYPFCPRASYVLRAALPGGSAVITQAQREATVGPPGPGNWLLIPSIGVKTQVLEGDDISILDRKEGVWHQEGEPNSGNLVIAGHRFKYLPPNTTTFYNLDQLKSGDTITLWWNGQRHSYRMVKSFTVNRDAVDILNPSSQEQLTIYTCTDLNASQRQVVVAKPLSV